MKALRNLAVLAVLGLSPLLAPFTSQAVSTNLVIVEVYGGGGNSGSVYKNDYIGVFNLGTSNVDVNGWSVQYASAAGASWQVTPLATSSKIIPPGGYFLVGETNGAGGTASLPTPDVIGGINLSGTAGKVALVNVTNALTTTAATGPTIVDFVGFGSTATTFEGAAPTGPFPTAAYSAQRNNSGCSDTDSNTNDFTIATCNPRNSSTPIHSCAVVTPPTIANVTPGGLTTNAGNNVSFTVTLSAGDTPLSYFWYKQATTTTLISGATTATLTLTNVTAADAASYFVVVSNASTVNATSGPVTLGVNDPAINGQPLTTQNLLLGSTARIIVNAAGTSPLGYQWFTGTPGSGIALVDNGRIVGSTNSALVISNLNAGDANTYYLVFSNTLGTLTSSTFTLNVVSTGGTVALWDFNTPFDTNNPASTIGYGTGNVVNLNDTFVLGAAFGDANDDATDNGGNSLAWGTANYPAATVSNLQAGVAFNVSTVGAKNIKGSYDVRETSSSTKYLRLQYTTNGVDYTNYPASFAFTGAASSFSGHSFDLTGFPGVANNPSFGIRLVAEFESTATYGVSNTASYIGVSATYSGSGTVSFDLVNITGDAISGAYNPPTVSAISNVTFSIANSGSATVTASGAAPLTITATSLNHAILSDPSVSGTTLTLNGVAVGVAPVVVTVTDANGNATSTSFQITVTALNVAPTVVGLYATNIVVGTPLSYAFNVSDDHTAPGSLTFAVSSGNTSLVPSAGVVLGGSGTNRTLTITPVAGATGVAPITVSVGDNDPNPLTNTVTFAVMILPSTNVLLIDGFDYNGTNPIITASAGLWVTHSGTAGQLTVGGGVATIDGVNHSEDVHALLIGQPYSTNSAVVLYSSFTLNYQTLPSVGGSYLAHFRDENSGAATGFGARVWASELNAATSMYRIGIGNGAEATNTSGQFPLDLSPSNNYTIVTRYVESNGVSTIWVNPTSESSQSVTATDVPLPTDSAPNAINVSSYAMRESNSDEGICTLDNLKVGLHFADVVAVVAPPPSVAISESGTNIVVTWPDPTYSLQSSTNAATGYTTISGATSPYTNTSSASATFYRLVQ